MSSNVVNRAPFLRTSREFPGEIEDLTMEIDKTYVDIAAAVNQKTIGIFPTNIPAQTGESWFLQGNSRQQGFRQVYNLSTGLATFNHGLVWSNIAYITKLYGIGFDGTNYYPLPYVDATSATNQIAMYISPAQVVITPGAGSPPAITTAIIVVEWIANV